MDFRGIEGKNKSSLRVNSATPYSRNFKPTEICFLWHCRIFGVTKKPRESICLMSRMMYKMEIRDLPPFKSVLYSFIHFASLIVSISKQVLTLIIKGECLIENPYMITIGENLSSEISYDHFKYPALSHLLPYHKLE